ncbi:BCL2 modifying factor 1 [Puntigrus tetrazona]|uniref:BCL2 modifying factor 1 n=1 Tax=Puntigrus tetrazona TaxID=1606681 RepID=UPI001C8974E8|nr:BCL2 modifying factor 1 [Puntigrus tetrazona]
MDEDEDDVHRKALQRWPSSHVQIKPSETAGRANGMLPCRVRVEPRRLLYGNAGLLLLAAPSRSRPPDDPLRQNQRVMDPAESVESLIGQKLQLIGDQFYQEHMMHHRNQRNRDPLWWRVAVAFYTLVFGRDADARAERSSALGTSFHIHVTWTRNMSYSSQTQIMVPVSQRPDNSGGFWRTCAVIFAM